MLKTETLFQRLFFDLQGFKMYAYKINKKRKRAEILEQEFKQEIFRILRSLELET